MNRRWVLALLCLQALAAPVPAAGELDGEFAILSATAAFHQGVVELDADVRYPMGDRISEALKGGVTLTFELEINVERERRFWFDAGVMSLVERRELSYSVISDRYVVSAEGGAEPQSFPSLQGALEQIGHVANLPIAIEAQMRGSGPWLVNVRAGVRRGRIPDALRVMMFWSDDWHRTCDWYTWTLER